MPGLPFWLALRPVICSATASLLLPLVLLPFGTFTFSAAVALALVDTAVFISFSGEFGRTIPSIAGVREDGAGVCVGGVGGGCFTENLIS